MVHTHEKSEKKRSSSGFLTINISMATVNSVASEKGAHLFK